MSKKTTIDDLAVMVKNGFDETHKRIDSLRTEVGDFRIETNERFKQVDDHLGHIDARLDDMAKDIATIQRHFVYRYEFDDLMGRVKYLEEKMGIESGK